MDLNSRLYVDNKTTNSERYFIVYFTESVRESSVSVGGVITKSALWGKFEIMWPNFCNVWKLAKKPLVASFSISLFVFVIKVTFFCSSSNLAAITFCNSDVLLPFVLMSAFIWFVFSFCILVSLKTPRCSWTSNWRVVLWTINKLFKISFISACFSSDECVLDLLLWEGWGWELWLAGSLLESSFGRSIGTL